MFVEAWRVQGSTRDETESAAASAFGRPALHDPTFDLRAESEKPWARVWVARRAALSEPTGFLVAWHVADEFHILSVAVETMSRRCGVGRALMEVALNFARTNQARIVLLEVRSSNRPAIELYRKLGFSELRVRPKYYADTGEDALEMWLDLEAARV